MVQSLDKKWKEFLFSFSGFGPNFLMVLMGAYYTDALNPVAFEGNSTYQAIASGVCFITPALFPILFALGKVFDGIIDIPFAHITDTLSTKWGRRRPAIAVCFIPMVVGFVLSWIPIGGAQNPMLNTIWVSFWNIIFFAAYTMCLIAYYGSLSTVCTNEPQRLRVSGYKSFFDTISYCLVYALVPLLLDSLKIHVDKFVFICMPLMLTMLIPLFMIKEGEKYGYPEDAGLKAEKISIVESLRLTFKNKVFLNWTFVNCCTFFGLQMFLSAMNGMIIGGMGFNGAEMAIVNTCAFAPVPVMLYLFNKLKAKRGVRFTYQSCLLLFAVAIMSFFFASTFVCGEDNKIVQYVIGCLGGVCGSWAIGAFFMMPYLAPAQISSVEMELTGKNHSAMYFAANAVTTSIVGAISGSLVYEYVKNLFISKAASGVVWAQRAEDASHAFGLGGDVSQVYNLGNLLVPFIVCITCVAGFFIAFRMPRDYTPAILAREFKKMDPSLDISAMETQEVPEEKGEIIFVQAGLSILSGFIFGFIWLGLLLKAIKRETGKGSVLARYLLGSLIPFGGIFVLLRLRRELLTAADGKGVKLSVPAWLLVASGLMLPILPVNIIALAVVQHGVNKLYENEG
ncbi:MAG: MFS transporter [Ruminococcaceae bacterium]|nr:MFS transporter [Oscillospiraceae bacterium]